ncbi:MAG TPA: cytochrome c oxidase subunit II [Stellaceae bacterium]|nr:cytochrome c oxidase subunit II [Stellaceae bacterium]
MDVVRIIRGMAGSLMLPLMAVSALAAGPEPWQIGMQKAATPVRERMDALNNELLVIITGITLFVLVLLLYVMVRFNARRHPVPSKTAHNSLIEVIWTLAPALILVIVAVPSFQLLFYADRIPSAEMTINVKGHQWNWEYTYPDQGGLHFTSLPLSDEDVAKGGKLRLLDVDNPLVVPAGTNIRILVEGEDVIHSWFVPTLGVQEYAVKGHTNESWMRVDQPGMYYGQCNQICGVGHPFMPIAVKVVPKTEFETWVTEAKQKFALTPAPDALHLAQSAQ